MSTREYRRSGNVRTLDLSGRRRPSIHPNLFGAVDWLATGRVALAFGLKPEDIHADTRGVANVALARQVSMYILHVALGMTFSDAGGVFGRDRTTAAHACKVVEDMRDDPVFDKMIAEIEVEMQTCTSKAFSFKFCEDRKCL